MTKIYINDYTAKKTSFDYKSLSDNVVVLPYLTHHNILMDIEKYCDNTIVNAYRYRRALNKIVVEECKKCLIDNPLTEYYSSKEKCVEHMVEMIVADRTEYEKKIDKLNKEVKKCNEQIDEYLKLL